MKHSAELLRCLEECDVSGAAALWAAIAPHLPQPNSDFETLATIHMTRTRIDKMRFRLRAYSHKWLLDHNLPSALPDELRPRAERIYPRVIEGVGIATRARSPSTQSLSNAIHTSMREAVLECYADGRTEPEFVKARIMSAREKILRS